MKSEVTLFNQRLSSIETDMNTIEAHCMLCSKTGDVRKKITAVEIAESLEFPHRQISHTCTYINIP